MKKMTTAAAVALLFTASAAYAAAPDTVNRVLAACGLGCDMPDCPFANR